jgi:hypothetical protein
MGTNDKPATPAVVPMTDPLGVPEVYTNDVTVQVRESGVQLTFCSIRAAGTDSAGVIKEERVVVSRVAMPISLLSSIFAMCQQLGIIIQQQQTLASAPTDTKPN